MPGFAAGGGVGWMAVAVALGLAWWLVALELRRRPRPVSRALRAGATVVAVLSLLLLVLGPGRWGPESTAEAWLLTPGARLPAPEPGPGTPLLSLLPASRAGRLPAAARTIPDAGYAARHHPSLRRVGILGDGLHAWDWDRLPAAAVWIRRGAGAPGVERVWWPRRIPLGDDLPVLGSLGPGGGPAVLTLSGPGGVEDRMDREEGGAFRLRARPREPGRFLYRLRVTGNDGTIRAEEGLDVLVERPERVSVLWLESAPGFETRHFKSWLAGRGDALAVRSAISRERYRSEFHNLEDRDLSRIGPDLLEGLDVLVADDQVLSELPPGELRALRAAVRDGLGLLVRPRGERLTRPAEELLDMSLRPLPDLEEIAVRPEWPGAGGPAVLSIGARELRAGASAAPLVEDAAGRTLAAARGLGRGKAALTLIDTSYRWVLEGNADLHGRYWTRLLRAVARERRGAARWESPAGPVLVHQPLTLALWSPDPAPRARVSHVEGKPERLALRQSPLQPARWTASYWPARAGWHRLTAGGDESWFHVAPRGSWEAWEGAERRAATDLRVALGPPADPSPPARPVDSFLPFPRAPLFLSFLAAMGALWIGERRGMRTIP